MRAYGAAVVVVLSGAVVGCMTPRRLDRRLDPEGGAPGSHGASGPGCVPASCEGLGAECGVVPDGCGGVLDCGRCELGLACGAAGPNLCGAGECEPLGCEELGASCGVLSDGCAGVIDCGSCATPETCGGGGTSGACGCRPSTCEELGAECGRLPDGCGGEVSCGECAAGETCGGGDAPNRCGAAPCVPTSCAASGVECGALSDGCGGMLDCGSCVAPETCGGGGTPGVCGCRPRTCAELGASCGTQPDGCGGTLSCGSCPAGGRCEAGACVCDPDEGEPNDEVEDAPIVGDLAIPSGYASALVGMTVHSATDDDYFLWVEEGVGAGELVGVEVELDGFPSGSDLDLVIGWACSDGSTPSVVCETGTPYGSTLCYSAAGGTVREAVETVASCPVAADLYLVVGVWVATYGGSCAPYDLRVARTL